LKRENSWISLRTESYSTTFMTVYVSRGDQLLVVKRVDDKCHAVPLVNTYSLKVFILPSV